MIDFSNLPAKDKIYYQDDSVVIYCADCRLVLPLFPDKSFDLVLTDPPYGIEGDKGQNAKHGKGNYDADFEDTPEYFITVTAPVIIDCINRFGRVVLTPPSHLIHKLPQPNTIGCYFMNASASWSSWGILTTIPIYYYGKDPRGGKRQMPDGLYLREAAPRNGHPCAKPIKAWMWLLNKSSLIGEVVFDPFLGSGTTCVAAKILGRRSIGIEISEKYCEIAKKRCSQSVMQLDIPKEDVKQETML